MEAERLAKILLTSSNMPAAAVTIAEAEAFLALTGSDPVSDSVTPVSSPKLTAAANLLSTTEPDASVLFEFECAKAHLELLAGSPQRTLEILQGTKVTISRDYQRVIVVKHRALMGASLMALGRAQDALRTFKTIEVSTHTLQTIPEAARWAEIMYNIAVDAAELTNQSADILMFLRLYAQVVRTGEIIGRKPLLTALVSQLSQLEPTEELNAEKTALEQLLAAMPEPNAKAAIGESQRHVIASPLSPASTHMSFADASSTVNEHEGHNEKSAHHHHHHHGLLGRLRRHPHQQDAGAAESAVAVKNTTGQDGDASMSEKRKRTDLIEREAVDMVNTWRDNALLHEPYSIALGEDRKNAQALQAKIIESIGRTFSSAVLMRLNAELLYSMNSLDEARAAFATYVMLQGQQLLKQSSGAEASPDSDGGVARVFSQRASVIEAMANTPYGYEIVDAAAELVQQLEEIMPKDDPEAVSAAHGVLARCATMEAIRAEGNDYYNARLEAAAKHYEKALLNWEGDGPFHRARAQFLMFTKGPAATFEHLQSVLGMYQTDIVLVNELIMSLTAQEQFDSALQIAELFLESNPPADELTPFERTQYLNLKKSHVAVIESLKGSAAALDELPAVMDLATTLYPAASISAANASVLKQQDGDVHKNGTAVNGSANGKSNGKISSKANGKTHGKVNGSAGESINSSRSASQSTTRNPQRRATLEYTTDEPAHGFTVGLLPKRSEDLKRPQDLVELWIWVSQLYTRAGQLSEAKAAIDVAAESGRTANVICAEAYLISNPRRQFATFQRAHSYDPMSLRAVLGLAVVLSDNTVIVNGKYAPDAVSKVCETTEEELDMVQALVSTLEDMTTRALGRQTPEAWYLLGVLYSVLGDHQKARRALWDCVAVEEKTGVRQIIPSLQL